MAITDLLFDTPWWLPTGIAVVGIAILVSGNRRTKAALRNTGAVILLIAIALALVSYFVNTQKEKCIIQARSLIHAAAKQDGASMRRLLDSQTAVNGILIGPDQIIPVAQSGAAMYHLDSLTILSTDAQRTGTVITVSTVVLAQSDVNQPVRVDCQFQWNQTGEDWRLQNIDLTNIAGHNPDDLIRHAR